MNIINTPHGDIETPAFIFCATKGAIKGLSVSQMRQCGTQIILSNTYHLMLQPGEEVVKSLGGLQKMTGWRGPMLTDSGGFQVFSLGYGSVSSEIKGNRSSSFQRTVLKIEEEGVLFKSYLDGKRHLLTPERSIQIQRDLGADLILVFDECTAFHVGKDYTKNSMARSHRWALRSLKEFHRIPTNQHLYGIVQGGAYPDLRKESADFINNQPFFGHAIGGSLGQTQSQMHDVVALTAESLRKDRPIHLLGIGGIKDIWHGVECGIDTFDCVHPTRLARHGGALTKRNHSLNLRNAKYQKDILPIEEDCLCQTCKNYSRGYIHHLLKAKEILGYSLIMIHNVTFLNKMMEDIRNSLHDPLLFKEKRTYWGG